MTVCHYRIALECEMKKPYHLKTLKSANKDSFKFFGVLAMMTTLVCAVLIYMIVTTIGGLSDNTDTDPNAPVGNPLLKKELNRNLQKPNSKPAGDTKADTNTDSSQFLDISFDDQADKTAKKFNILTVNNDSTVSLFPKDGTADKAINTAASKASGTVALNLKQDILEKKATVLDKSNNFIQKSP